MKYVPETKTLLTVSSSPHIRDAANTPAIMRDVVIALVPALVAAVVIFGVRALAVVCVSVAACVFFEWAYRRAMHKPQTIGDCSAVVTGVLLAYCLPSSIPLWVPVIGAAFAIVFVKQLFGGLGKNFMNPALAARAFLFSWPKLMNSFPAPFSYRSIFNLGEDAVASATPMASLHAGTAPAESLLDLFLGSVGGSLGEVSAAALLLGGIYLVARKVISPRIPVSYLATVAVVTFLFPRGDAGAAAWMCQNLLGGGLFLGAIFMATDYSTSPVTHRGQVIFGVGCGLLTVFIRYFGSYPEGVSYSILIMNACVGLIDSNTRPRRFGAVSGKGGRA